MIKKFLFFLSSKQKTYLSIVFFLILIYSLFEVINLGLVLPIFEYYISGDTNLINKLIFNEKLNKYIDKYYFFPMFIFIILIILKNFFYLILFWFQNEFNFNVQISITNRVFKKYIEQNYTDFIKRNSSEYLKNIITETPVIGQSVCNLSLILLTEIMVSIGIFIVILTYNFKVSLI